MVRIEYGGGTSNMWKYGVTGEECGAFARRWEATVRSIRRQHLRHDLIDFASSEPAGGFTCNEHLRVGPVTLTPCTSCPIEGKYLASPHVIVAIHEGKAVGMSWAGPEPDPPPIFPIPPSPTPS